MKKKIALFLVALILVTGCQPSETAIQTAIARTQSALPTLTLAPAITPQQAVSPLRYTVTYEVLGDGITLAHIAYKTTSGIITEEDIEPHFQVSYVMDIGYKMRLTAEVLQGSGLIRCRITLNGVIIDNQEATGGPGTSVACEGTVR